VGSFRPIKSTKYIVDKTLEINAMDSNQEEAVLPEPELIWKGKPSQFMNIQIYALCLTATVWLVSSFWQSNIEMVMVAIIPILFAAYCFFNTAAITYMLTEQEFIFCHGLFSPQQDPLELYKVLDRVPIKPWYMGMFNLGHVRLDTMDETTPRLSMRAINDPMGVSAKIRYHSENAKQKRGFRTFNVQSA